MIIANITISTGLSDVGGLTVEAFDLRPIAAYYPEWRVVASKIKSLTNMKKQLFGSKI